MKSIFSKFSVRFLLALLRISCAVFILLVVVEPRAQAATIFTQEIYTGIEGQAIVVGIRRPSCCLVSMPVSVDVIDQYAKTSEQQRRTVTWAANDTATKSLNFTFPNNLNPGSDGFTQVEAIRGNTNYTPANLIWRDNDISFQVVQTTISAAENSNSVNVLVRRDSDVGEVSVDYATVNGSAIAGADFTATQGTLTWRDGDQGQRLITIPILADTTNEQNETFTLSLSNPRIISGAETVQLSASNTATVTIVNAAVNAPPVANDGAVRTDEDTPLNIDLLALQLASDPDSSEFYVSALPTLPVNGSASFNGRRIVYTPALNFNGTDEFTYQVSDLQGGTATARITVNVPPVNDPPVIRQNPLYRAVLTGGTLNIDLSDNVSDADGNTIVVSDTTSPQNGQVTFGTGLNLTYTPNAQYIGEDRFDYYVTDGTETNNGTATGTIIITVGRGNTPPQAVNLNTSASTGQSVTINLANAVTDQDNDALSITVPERTAHGSLSVNGLVVTYIPDSGYTGDDLFEYTVDDGYGGRATATITLRISAVAPAAEPINIKVIGGDVQLARLNTNAALRVEVTNETGAPLSGAAVSWSATEPGGTQPTITATDPVTDASGSARASLTTSNMPTRYQVTVTVGFPETEISRQATFTVASGLNALTRPETPEGALAGVLDSMCPGLQAAVESLTAPQQALLTRCNEIMNAATDGNDGQIIAALRALAPDEVAAQGRIGNSFAQQQLGNIGTRLAALRSGASGVGLAGLSFNIKGRIVPGTVLAQALEADARNTTVVDMPQAAVPRWGGFISGTIGGGDKDATSKEEGFNFRTRGVTAGADYRFSSATVFGGALGYARSDVDIDANGGGLDASGLSLSLYGTYYRTQSLYFDAVLNYAGNDYKQTRNIDYTVGSTRVQETARSDTASKLVALSMGGGYEFAAESGASAEISLRLHRLASTIDGYTETGANALDLTLGKQTIRVLTSSLGTRGSWPLNFKWGVLIPQLDISWQHEFDSGAHQIKGHFVNDQFATTFAFDTDEPDRDYFQLGLGASAIIPGGKTAFLQYQTTLGRADYRDYNVALGMRLELR